MDGQWVSLRDAAESLGVSTDTVRRRLKRGELPGEQRSTPHGPSWFVLLPRETAAAAASGDEPQATGAFNELAGAAIELAVLQERVVGLEATLTQVQEERDRLVQGERELRALLHQQAIAFTLALPSSTQGSAYADAEGEGAETPEAASDVAYDNTPTQNPWQALMRRLGFA
jgi:hypothetical protein